MNKNLLIYKVDLDQILNLLSERKDSFFVLQQIGAFFRIVRQRENLSLQEAALRLGVSEKELSSAEKGEGLIPIRLTMALCEKFQVQEDFVRFLPFLENLVSDEELDIFLRLRPLLQRLGILV